MSVKASGTFVPDGDFPVASAEHVQYHQGKNLKDAHDDLIGDFLGEISTKNLFRINNKVLYQQELAASLGGAAKPNSACNTSDFIPVTEGDVIYFSYNGAALAQYNLYYTYEFLNGAFIQSVNSSAVGYTYTVPAGVSHIRLCISTTRFDKFQAEVGGITPWVPGSITTKLDAEVSTVKSDVAAATTSITTIQTNVAGVQTEVTNTKAEVSTVKALNQDLLTETSTRNRFRLTSGVLYGKELNNTTGVPLANVNANVSDFIKVTEGEQLYFSYNGTALAAFQLFFIYQYLNGVYLSPRVDASAAGYSYTVPAGVSHIRLCLHVSVTAKFQVETGGITSWVSGSLPQVLNAEVSTVKNEFASVKTAHTDLMTEIATKNRFKITSGILYNSELVAGQPQYNANASVSDFIAVTEGEVLYFSYNGVALTEFLLFFIYKYLDGVYVPSSVNASAAGFTYTVPAGVSHIRLCLKTTKIDKFQVEVGGITPWMAGSIITDVKTAVYSNNMFNPIDFIYSTTINSAGAWAISTDNYGTSKLMQVKPGKTLNFKNGNSSVALNDLKNIIEYSNVPGFTGRADASAAGYSYTIPAGVYYIRVVMKNSLVNTLDMRYSTPEEYIAAKPDVLNTTVSKAMSFMKNLPLSNPLEVIRNDPGLMHCYLHVGCIGDSLASGLAVSGVSTGIEVYPHSWGQYLARMTGNTYYNWSKGGYTTASWLASTYATECFDGNHKCEAYLISLGQNDKNNSLAIGTAADIVTSDSTGNSNADTYYGRMGKIIQKIKALQPKAKIFLLTDPLDLIEIAGYNTALRNIAPLFTNVYLVDLYTYGTHLWFSGNMGLQRRYAHYNAIGYYQWALIIATYVDWIMRTQPSEFQEIEFIGTDYAYTW